MAELADSGLSGQRVLVTRSRSQASSLVALLAARGARPIELPTIEIREPIDLAPLDAAIDAIGSYDWIMFTSANAVRAVSERLIAKSRTAADLGTARLGAVGRSTESALIELGLSVELCPPSYLAESLVAELRRYDLRGARILLPQANEARDVLARGLTDLGATVDRVVAYRTIEPSARSDGRRLFLDGQVDVITLTSSSTARNLLQAIGDDALDLIGGAVVASIGPVTSAAARGLGLRVAVEAEEHTVAGLVDALDAYLGGIAHDR
jgi:uroporphyrinogen-III synthase